MFNRLSTKIRNSANSKKKPLFALPSPAKSKSKSNSGCPDTITNNNNNDDESLDSYSNSYVESLFPVDDDLPHHLGNNRNFDDVQSPAASFSYSDEFDLGSRRSFPTSSSVPEDEINAGPAVLPDFDEAEEEFLEEFEDYFENLSVDNIRKEQYVNLDLQRIVHLDYANHPLFSRSQVEEHMRFLVEETACSAFVPESNFLLRSRISGLGERILSLFNTTKDEYAVFFTTGRLSGGFKFLGEAYPFDRSTQLLICQDAHDQIRQLLPAAAKASTRTTIVPLRSDLCIANDDFSRALHRATSRLTSQRGLVVIPAQSGLSGSQHPLDLWIQQTQFHKGWHVAVDVSQSFPAAGAIDLAALQPEFLVGCLENSLGYPPGMGFLIVKRVFYPLLLKKLRKKQPAACGFESAAGVHVVCEENGMIKAVDLVAVAAGLQQLEITGVDRICKRVSCLRSWLRTHLKKIRHANDQHSKKPMVKLYGGDSSRGSILVFNLVDSTGNLFPPRIVQRLAEKQNIRLGICDFHNHPMFLGARSGPLVSFTAVILSLGCVSSFQDSYRFIQFLTRFRDEEYMSVEAMGYIEDSKI